MRRPMLVVLVWVLVIGGAWGLLLSPANAAAAVPVTACGTTITTDAYLAHDLVCSSGTGITFKASVTLDLRGHRLIGPGRSSANFAGSNGVYPDPDSTPVSRVTHGRLSGWDKAVGTSDFTSVRDRELRVDHVVVQSSSTGLTAPFTGSLTADHVIVNDVDLGVDGSFGYANVSDAAFRRGDRAINAGTLTRLGVTRTVITGQREVGIACFRTYECTITRSLVWGNEVGIQSLRALSSVSRVIVDHNAVGMVAGVTYAICVGTPCAVGPADPRADIANSRFTNNTTGLQVEAIDQAVAINSYFGHNTVGVRVPVLPDTPLGPNTVGARSDLRSNTFRANHDGVLVTDVLAATTLGHNTADRNTRWGLYAVGSVTDLGGNVAHRNGAPAQCFGVSCA